MPKEPFLFDSYAVFNFFQKAKSYEKVVRILEQADKAKLAKYINVINLGEIIYATKREFGDLKKIEVLAHRERLNFVILPVTNALVYQAAEFKAQYRISYADCFVLASAVEHKALIVTGYPEFKKVEHLVNIAWI